MTKPSEDIKLEILNDHYKETVIDFRKTGKSRDLSFTAILILLGLMIFQFASPDQSQSLLTQIINSRLGIDATFSINLLGSLIWLVLLFVSVRYFQAVINLEKQYNYSHELEELLAKKYDGRAFTREGKSYLKDYPIFSEWLHLIYRTLFPTLLTITLTIKIITEWLVVRSLTFPLVLDSLIYVGLIISIGLFVYSLHKTEKHTEQDID